MRIGFCTTLWYFLSHQAQTFKLTKHSFLNSIGSDLDPNRFFANLKRERERERERLVYAHPFGKIRVHRQIDKERERERERERDREMCVLFEFRQFFNSENLSTYFKVSCIS